MLPGWPGGARSARRRARRRAHRRLVALAAAGAALLSACGGGSGGKPASTPPTTTGVPIEGGTVTWAEAPGSAPDYIFPLYPYADDTEANVEDFQRLLYRPLYWFGDDDEPGVDYDRSLAAPPVWSDHDTVVTVTLDEDATWSDGEPVDARDVELWMNLLDAEKTNWAAYVPGYFPDNVLSVTAPAGPTGKVVVFALDRSYNPTWFLDNELSQITPLPVAWDRTSSTGPTPTATDPDLPDTTPAGARKVYDYLAGQARQVSTYATNPLWRIVDGPWTLASLTPAGEAVFVPNPRYAGPDAPHIAKFVEVPFLSDATELDQVEDGPGALTYGYIPAQFAVPSQISSVEAGGYVTRTEYAFGVDDMALNFDNLIAGPLFDQLYLREALQSLVDQTGWIDDYDGDLAEPDYGPVPVEPPSTYADSFERSDPYPSGVAEASALLRAHGWTVVDGGTSTCTDPGTGPNQCGAAIVYGEGLDFDLLFSSGFEYLAESVAELKAVAAEAGIQLTTTDASFDTVAAAAVACQAAQPACAWQIVDWGSGRVYSPASDPTGEELFATGAESNAGSYTSPEADELIAKAATASPSQSQGALDGLEDYVAEQLPVLFQPDVAGQPAPGLDVVDKTLEGATPNFYGNLTPESWYFVSSRARDG